nr:RNA-directed DNA polymerase, eukaryota, reverse transcriptase zinc-binding domain protein [Tanacetum cinerariifolium]
MSQFSALQSLIEEVVLTDQCYSWKWLLDVPAGFWVASALLARWWELDISVCAYILEWFEWLGSLHVSNKAMLTLEGIGGLCCRPYGAYETV